jgi:hypothetical protein
MIILNRLSNVVHSFPSFFRHDIPLLPPIAPAAAPVKRKAQLKKTKTMAATTAIMVSTTTNRITPVINFQTNQIANNPPAINSAVFMMTSFVYDNCV